MAIQRSSVIKTRNTNINNEEVSEFDGGYLNIGVNTIIDGESVFIRLPLGVAVTDLAKRKRKISKKLLETNPDFAAKLQIENQMIDQICEAFLGLEGGESVATDVLDVQLYRKGEEADMSDAAAETPAFDLFAKA